MTPSKPSRAKALLLASRPKTLVAAILPVLAGSALGAKVMGRFEVQVFNLSLLATLFIQIATNYFNDALDHRKGADTAKRLGPKRATAGGLLTFKEMILWAALMLALALVCGLPLIQSHGWPILLIGLLSLYLSFGYTGGPFPLAYLGLGEVFVFVFFGLIAVGGSYYLQTATAPNDLALALGAQMGAFSTVLISINNLRDLEEDRQSNKRTLAVKLGARPMRHFLLLLHALPYLLLHEWKDLYPWAAYLPLLVLPLSLFILKKIYTSEASPYFNKLLALSALQYLLFTLLLIGGLTWPSL
jgi:1,4-dihydroxy-2-naphthoate octaprenyltransferase